MKASKIQHWWLGQGGSDPQQQIPLTGLTLYDAMGNSITAGTAASTTANRYVNQFASGKAMTLTNRGTSGHSARNTAATASALTLNQGNKLITCMTGLNTIGQISDVPGQFGQTCYTEIEVGYRHVLTRGSIKGTEVASGNAAVTRTGTIAAFSASTGGNCGTFPSGTLPGQFATASTGPASWDWVCPGTAFCVSFVARALHGTGDIRVNGAVIATYDLKKWYSGSLVGPMSMMFRGIPAGATITVTASGDATVALDYFSEIKDPLAPLITDRPASFLFADIPLCTTAGYAALGTGVGNVTKSVLGSAVIKSIVDEFLAIGYNIARVQTNEYYNPVNTTDGIHPNDTGMDQLTNAFNAAVIL